MEQFVPSSQRPAEPPEDDALSGSLHRPRLDGSWLWQVDAVSPSANRLLEVRHASRFYFRAM
jgi:hypothetical protein